MDRTGNTKSQKKREGGRACFALLVLLVMLLVAAVSGCGGNSSVQARYEATGTVSYADIWYDNDGNFSYTLNNPLPWSADYTATKGEWTFFAAYASHYSGYVTVKIYVNGSVAATATNAPGGAFYGQDKAEISFTF